VLGVEVWLLGLAVDGLAVEDPCGSVCGVLCGVVCAMAVATKNIKAVTMDNDSFFILFFS
jgi:hypothetical protein